MKPSKQNIVPFFFLELVTLMSVSEPNPVSSVTLASVLSKGAPLTYVPWFHWLLFSVTIHHIFDTFFWRRTVDIIQFLRQSRRRTKNYVTTLIINCRCGILLQKDNSYLATQGMQLHYRAPIFITVFTIAPSIPHTEPNEPNLRTCVFFF
jgi:hypothetical protein